MNKSDKNIFVFEGDFMLSRVNNLRELMSENGLEALLINNPANRRYLTGFTGTAGSVLLTQERAILITDFRYTEQAKEQAPEFEIREFATKQIELLADLRKELGIEELGFEARHETYHQYLQYQKQLEVELQGTENLVKQLRLTKEESEIEKIQQAVEITDQAFAEVADWIKPGFKERNVSLKLEFAMKEAGASDKAFDFIVASGPRSALPHGVASNKEIKAGEFVTMDIGCVYDGYHSDMTRTVIVGGEPTAQQKEIYQLVLAAQKEALENIEPGMKASAADQIARNVIADAGYSDNFGHGLGHGVGLEIHEGPKLSWQDDTVLKPGMVVTVEPGVYLPDWGGVRIEDIVVIREEGCEILTSSPKELMVIDN